VKIGALLMCVTGGLSLLFPEFLIGLFNPDLQVIEAGKTSLRMMGVGAVFIAIGLILAQALFGAGNSKFVMWAEMLLHFLCLIPISYLFGVVLDLGLVGVWAAALLYIVLLAGVMAWKFARGEWKHIRL
jgi:Na+-driven multidrug efflux pump